MTRTFAPWLIMLSTSVSCTTLFRFASLSMNLPPPASMAFCIDGLSAAAQRGCWKLFHDTPTVQPAPPEPAAAADPPALAAGLPPLLLHAAAITATAPTSSPNRRFIL